jgi:tyrosyl-tRNA synthetase
MAGAFDILKERGFVSQVTDEEAVRRAFETETVTCYIGFDPTARSLHVGNLVPIMMLANIERCGHKPIALVGGGTAMIADPTGKDEMRPMLTTETIDDNIAWVKRQLGHYLDFESGKTLMVNNAEWLRQLNYIDFLREIGTHFSVNRMLTAEAYKMRMETGLTFQEFNYQILQSYDFLMLFRNYGCSMQLGGDDQWGNILAGVDLIRRKDRASAEAITSPLLTTSDGKKMGKTAGGAIWLSANMLSPYDYYQFWVNTDDRDVGRFLALFTFLPMEEIHTLASLEGADIRQAKSILAYEATKITHGEEEAKSAVQAAQSAFAGGSNGSDNLPTTEIDPARLEAGINVMDLFVETNLSQTKSEVRRLIQQGGASVNGERVPDIDLTINADHLDNGAILLRAGKKRYHRVVLA